MTHKCTTCVKLLTKTIPPICVESKIITGVAISYALKISVISSYAIKYNNVLELMVDGVAENCLCLTAERQ